MVVSFRGVKGEGIRCFLEGPQKGILSGDFMKKKCILSMILSVFLIGTATVPCFAGTVEDLENKISDSQNNLQNLQAQLNDLEGQYTVLQTQAADRQYELQQLEMDLEDAKSEKKEQHEGMKTRIRYIYEALGGNGDAFELCATILGGASVTADDENIAELTRYDREMLSQYQDTCHEIEDKTEEVKAEKQELQNLEAECRNKQQEISSLISQTTENINAYQQQLTDAKDAELLEQIRQQEANLQAVFLSDAEENASESVTQVAESSAVNAAAGNSGTVVTAVTEESGASSGKPVPSEAENSGNVGWSGTVLNRSNGVVTGPTGKETYYNLDMSGVVSLMRQQGNTDSYWVRDDGVKMLGDYVIVAANTDKYPKGTIVDSSLGKAIVCDTGDFARSNADQLDVAVAW